MNYRSPVPKGPLKEDVIVDDYDTCCIVPRTMRADEPAEDTDALAGALRAYAAVGLHPQPKKTFIAEDNADFWGATIQEEIGRVRAHREVTVRTVMLVLTILKQRTGTARVWVPVIGLVVYVSLYARTALSFLDAVFHEEHSFDPGEVFVPSRRARAELGAAHRGDAAPLSHPAPRGEGRGPEPLARGAQAPLPVAHRVAVPLEQPEVELVLPRRGLHANPQGGWIIIN